jgi:hypothetical protein
MFSSAEDNQKKIEDLARRVESLEQLHRHIKIAIATLLLLILLVVVGSISSVYLIFKTNKIYYLVDTL